MCTWYVDTDGDGYGDGAVAVEQCDQPVGYVDNPDDCYDDNADAKPGSPISAQEEDRGDGSWDYNCDDEETMQWPNLGTCPDTGTDPVTPGTTGWWYDTIPECGVQGSWKSNAASCPGAILMFKQRCR